MSGGSMDYIYFKVEEAASMTNDVEFSNMLRDAAKVLHDEEWWMSYDCSEDEYRKSLAEFKSKWFKGNRNSIIAELEKRLAELERQWDARDSDCIALEAKVNRLKDELITWN